MTLASKPFSRLSNLRGLYIQLKTWYNKRFEVQRDNVLEITFIVGSLPEGQLKGKQ